MILSDLPYTINNLKNNINLNKHQIPMKAIKVQGGVGGVAEEVGVVGGVAEEVGVGVGVMVMDWFDKGEYMHALIVYVSCYDYGVSQFL